VSVAKAPEGPYCYALADECGRVFYIGKGLGRRMFAHVAEAKRGKSGLKCERIRQMLEAGQHVQYRILGKYATHDEACAAERGFIAAHEGLTNLTAGGEGVKPDPKERMRRHAIRLLWRLKPYREWIEDMSDRTLAATIVMAGSPLAVYETIKAQLIAEVRDPSPNVLYIPIDCQTRLGWE